MTIFLFPQGGTVFAPAFEFDCELDEDLTDDSEITQHSVDVGAAISDFIANTPTEYNLHGLQTAAKLDGTRSRERVQKALQALRQLKKERQPVNMVAGYWTDLVVIKTVRARNDVSLGEALDISVALKVIERPVAQTAQIPPSRLKKKVKKKASRKKGGAKSKTPPKNPAKTRSWAVRLAGLAGG